MGVPDYQTILLPMLELLKDGREHLLSDVLDTLTEHFRITPEEAAQLLPSGSRIFYNRVGWAGTYLRKAGLIDVPRRSYYQITSEGKEFLKKKPTKLDYQVLRTLQKNCSHSESSKRSSSTPPKRLMRGEFSTKTGDVVDAKLAVDGTPAVGLPLQDSRPKKFVDRGEKWNFRNIAKEKDHAEPVENMSSGHDGGHGAILLKQDRLNNGIPNTRKFEEPDGPFSHDEKLVDTSCLMNASKSFECLQEVDAIAVHMKIQANISNHVPVDDGEDWFQELLDGTE